MTYRKKKRVKHVEEKIIYLPIETTARELDAKLALAQEALSNGYKVAIGKKGEIKKFAEYVGEGIYLNKDHNIKDFPHYNNKRRQKYFFCGLDEEGLVFLNNKMFLKRTLPHILNNLDMIFVFGEKQKQIINTANPMISHKIKKVGSPRFDLMRPEYLHLFDERVNNIKKRYGEYILINTSFQSGNRSRHYKNNLLEQMNNFYISNYGRSMKKDEYNHIINKQKYYKNLFDSYKQTLIYISKKFPHLNFVLRPHPSEDHQNWKNSFKNIKNIKVIFEGNVINWILGARAIIHTGCTTGIEAWAAQKPVIRYNPLQKISPYEANFPNLFGKYASSKEKLESALKTILNPNNSNDNKFQEQINIAKPYLESINGKTSSKRIIKYINKIYNKQSFKNLKYKQLIKKYNKKKRIKIIIKIFLRKNFYFKNIKNLTEGVTQKFAGIDKKYLRNFLNKLTKIENTNKKRVIIKRIDSDSFFLENINK